MVALIDIISYEIEVHCGRKSYSNIEELERELSKRLGTNVKVGKPFENKRFKNKLMVKATIKEEKHTRLGVEFIFVEKIEVVEL